MLHVPPYIYNVYIYVLGMCSYRTIMASELVQHNYILYSKNDSVTSDRLSPQQTGMPLYLWSST